MKNKRSMMESEYDVKDVIVIDNGTETIKIGVSGEDYPRVIFIKYSRLYSTQFVAYQISLMIPIQETINLNLYLDKH